MPKILINDLNLYYEQTGEGPDLVFVSGLSCDHAMWDVNQFKDRFRVLTFDNRGVGQSDVPEEPYKMKAFVDDTVALCHALRIKKAHFVGHSMGGHITQYIAAQHPHMVDKLVIACSEAQLSPIAYLATKSQVDLRYQNVPKRILIEVFLPVLFSIPFLADKKRVEKFIDFTLNTSYPQSDKGYIGQVEALDSHDTTHLLSKIKSPTFVLGCENDLITPKEGSEFLNSHIANSTLHIMRHCGHAPFMEHPKLFVKLILDFLNKN